MNLILERTDQVSYFTDMRQVFDAVGISPQDYDWYISDIETNINPAGFSTENQWISGDLLAAFLQQHDVQFIWAVFGAVPKGFRSTLSSIPYADGNGDYWSGKNLAPQLDGALFEIACWDCSATILINLPEPACRNFKERYTDARPLAMAART